jgi:hypothetical protein
MGDRSGRWIWLLGAFSVGVVLQGCREEEQNRPLLYDKGTYQGQREAPLDAQQVDELRSRTQNQKF